MRVVAALLALALVAPSLVPLSARAEVRPITFPVLGEFSYRNDFGEPRGGGTRAHEGIDIVADKMTPVVAAVDGVITFIAIPQASWGYSITIRDAEGYSYRYLHLNNDTPGTDDGAGGVQYAYAEGLNRGSRVTRGQVIGWVGDSGNAESTVSHLHFEIATPSREPINPYDSLFAAAGGQGTGTFVAPVVTGDEGSIEAEEQFVVTRQLQEGMVDRDVAGLHQELTTLGFYTGEISESYTSATREAVRKFQSSRGLTATGIADAATRRAILTAMKQPLLVPGGGSGSESLSLGSSGERVRELQSALTVLGYFTAAPTGYFGPITETAVVAFQKANGIDPIGVVGPQTRAALAGNPIPAGAADPAAPAPASAGTTSSYHFALSLFVGSRGEEVRQLQLRLAQEGHFHTDATGYFGPITEAAVIAYQRAHLIDPVGVVGPITRAALNAR